MTIINYPSLNRALNSDPSAKVKQLMVYGFKDCRYEEIFQQICRDSPNPENIFNWVVGCQCESYTFERDQIIKIKTRLRSEYDPYKAALVNIVMENVKRARKRLEPIPILFAIDISTDSSGHYPPSFSSIITNRGSLITFRELKRAYKLCSDPALPGEVRGIAEKTFKFVKVLVTESYGDVEESIASGAEAKTTSYAFEAIQAPWLAEAQESWSATLSAYRESKGSILLSEERQRVLLQKARSNVRPWRVQLLDVVKIDPETISKT